FEAGQTKQHDLSPGRAREPHPRTPGLQQAESSTHASCCETPFILQVAGCFNFMGAGWRDTSTLPARYCTVAYLRVSGLGRIGLILRGINVLPLTALNSSADLRGRFSLARLFVGVQRLAHADVTHRS